MQLDPDNADFISNPVAGTTEWGTGSGQIYPENVGPTHVTVNRDNTKFDLFKNLIFKFDCKNHTIYFA